ncbi:MAG: hypothetical protein ACLP36_05555 [Acidimicrobiales bacterium]|jgi:hypothetical protein
MPGRTLKETRTGLAAIVAVQQPGFTYGDREQRQGPGTVPVWRA